MSSEFNIARVYSGALDDLRGPNRKRKSSPRRVKAWINVSPARRMAVAFLGGMVTLGTAIVIVSKWKGRAIDQPEPAITDQAAA